MLSAGNDAGVGLGELTWIDAFGWREGWQANKRQQVARSRALDFLIRIYVRLFGRFSEHLNASVDHGARLVTVACPCCAVQSSHKLETTSTSDPKDRPLFEAAKFIEKLCVHAVVYCSGARQSLGSDRHSEQHPAKPIGLARSHPITCISVPVEFNASHRRDGCNDALVAALKIVGECRLVTGCI